MLSYCLAIPYLPQIIPALIRTLRTSALPCSNHAPIITSPSPVHLSLSKLANKKDHPHPAFSPQRTLRPSPPPKKKTGRARGDERPPCLWGSGSKRAGAHGIRSPASGASQDKRRPPGSARSPVSCPGFTVFSFCLETGPGRRDA